MDVATQVRERRLRLDLSVERLARLAKISVSTLKRIEDGDDRVKPERIARVVAALEDADSSLRHELLPDRLQRLAMEMLAISSRLIGPKATGYVADEAKEPKK